MVGIVVDAVSEISAAEKMKAMQEKYKDNTSLEKEIDEIKKHLEVMESLMDAQKARNWDSAILIFVIFTKDIVEKLLHWCICCVIIRCMRL